MNLDELSPFEQAGKAHIDAWDHLNDIAKEEYRAFWNEALEAAAGYLSGVLAKNHPHLTHAYEHAAENIVALKEPLP